MDLWGFNHPKIWIYDVYPQNMRIHPKLGFMAQEKWDSLQLGYLGRVDGGFRLQMSQLKKMRI